MTTTRTVKGTELADLVGSTDTVVKIGGRWYWLQAMHMDEPRLSGLFIWTVGQAKDPRLTTGSRKLQYVWKEGEFETRPRTAPVWDWVTRQIEREAAV